MLSPRGPGSGGGRPGDRLLGLRFLGTPDTVRDLWRPGPIVIRAWVSGTGSHTPGGGGGDPGELELESRSRGSSRVSKMSPSSSTSLLSCPSGFTGEERPAMVRVKSRIQMCALWRVYHCDDCVRGRRVCGDRPLCALYLPSMAACQILSWEMSSNGCHQKKLTG